MSTDQTNLGGAVVETPKGTVGYTRKSNLGNYESEEISVFVQFPVNFENEAETVAAANDAAFQAKSVVFAQLGLEAVLEEGILKVKAAFPGATTVQAPGRAEGNATGQAPIPAQSAEGSTGSSQEGATASEGASSGTAGDPICPEPGCGSPLWDNRAENIKRKAAGKSALPEGRCKNYAKPPKGTECPGVIWNWSKGK